MLRKLLARFEERFGPRHVEVAVVLHNLGATVSNAGRHVEAEALYRRALTIQRAKLGASHPEVALSLHNLAAVLGAQGRQREALSLHRKAHSIARRALGPKHPTTLACAAAAAEAQRSTKRGGA